MRVFILLVLFLFFAGCYSQHPIATTYPLSGQRHMQTAHHWNILAKDIAKRVKTRLKNLSLTEGLSILSEPVYIKEAVCDQARLIRCAFTRSGSDKPVLYFHFPDASGVKQDGHLGLLCRCDGILKLDIACIESLADNHTGNSHRLQRFQVHNVLQG